MAVELKEAHEGRILEVHVSGKLSADDYRRFVPECDRLIERHGKISLLFAMRDFHGWEAAALWQDLKFGLKHFSDIEKLAMVGDQRWEKWMSEFCRPFTKARIRYFDQTEIDQALRWVASESTEGGG